MPLYSRHDAARFVTMQSLFGDIFVDFYKCQRESERGRNIEKERGGMKDIGRERKILEGGGRERMKNKERGEEIES